MIKSLLAFLLFAFANSGYLFGQEVRLNTNMLVLGYIESPFLGVGAGVEAGVGKHFSLSFDFNWGKQHDGTALEYRPSVNYYIKTDQLGFFAGAAINFINLTESDESNGGFPGTKFYSLGINMGYKVLISDHWTIGFTAYPQYTPMVIRPEGSLGISAQIGVGYRL
jgi:hypothetical protein